MRHVLTFFFSKETKNTVVYQESADKTTGPVMGVGVLYVSKWALPEPWPTKLQVTVED